MKKEEIKTRSETDTSPSTLELRAEAEAPNTTPERQVELANNPSFIVKMGLLKNPNLCDKAREIIEEPRKIVDQIRKEINEKIKNILESNNDEI